MSIRGTVDHTGPCRCAGFHGKYKFPITNGVGVPGITNEILTADPLTQANGVSGEHVHQEGGQFCG